MPRAEWTVSSGKGLRRDTGSAGREECENSADTDYQSSLQVITTPTPVGSLVNNKVIRDQSVGRARSYIAILGAAAIFTAAPPVSATDVTPVSARGFIVVVHAKNPATAVKREDLSNVFFKRVVKWPDGRTADPVDLTMTQPARLAFSASIHKKSVGAVRSFWRQQIFSGREIPPAELKSEADVIAYVKSHPGAVGYVSSSAHLTKGVKPVSVLGIDSQ